MNGLARRLADLDAFLAKLEPSLPNLKHDIAVAPEAIQAYADAAPDLLGIVDNAAHVSQSIVEAREDLDAFLVSMIGLADVGTKWWATIVPALTDVLHLLVPTTDLTNRYHEALNCALAGMVPLANSPPMPVPGILVSTSFTIGVERYRYPADLPKVAATGGPHCADVDLPRLRPGSRPPFVVGDVGTNPWKYGNQGILLNSDGLKQLLFGPIDGPPRNTAQIGQPG